MKIYNIHRVTEEDERDHTPKKKKKRSFKNIPLRTLLIWGFRAMAAGILLLAILFVYYSKDLPDPNKLSSRNVPESTKIFDRNGQLIYEIHGEVKRTLVNLDQISPDLRNATIAVEDKDFYKHSGISFRGIIRSAWTDVWHLSKEQGASTITQQFVKNAILSKDKAWSRKIKEIILSLEMNARFSKDDILKLYLNEIPYGRNAYGIEAASQTYLGKHAKDLTLAESAYLAALPQAPSRYNPFGQNRKLLDDRKDGILRRMREQGYITEEQENKAKTEEVAFISTKTSIQAAHFVLYVQDYLEDKYGSRTLQEGGLKVYTTLDLRLQDIAQAAVKEGVEKSVGRNKNNNAALVAMDPKTGQILAMVGSKDYFGESSPAGCTPGKNCLFEPNFNVAISNRQPGSSIKPLIYATAFGPEFKYAPSTMIMDVVTNFGSFGGKDYIPHNYNGQQLGPLSMRKALAGSLNIPAVKTLALVGVDNAIQTLRDTGYTSPLSDCGLSLVLGGCEVKLIDHVAGYGVFAAGGVKHEKTAILKIEDKEGNILEEYRDNSKQVMDPQAAYLTTNIMSDNQARSYIFGANSPLILPGRPVAAKTGTTQSWKDGWAMGFTPSLVAGVWTGNNDGTLMRQGADGVVVAAPIWNRFMKEALADTPVENFEVPDGITRIDVDTVSGLLPTEYTPETKNEVFADYGVPTKKDNVHVPVPIDIRTNSYATADTPPEFITYRTFSVLHSEKPENPSWENPVIAWATANGYAYPPTSGNPTDPETTTGELEINIVEPIENGIISSIPFKVSVIAKAPTGISKVELLIDGELYQTLPAPPYVFTVNKKLSDGNHTLAVKATDKAGGSSNSSIPILVNASAPLTITEPATNTTAQFPLTLTAKSAGKLDNVNFYSQIGSQVNFIGTAEISSLGSGYEYSFLWQQTPQSGTYRIYATSSSGVQSSKITIIIP